MTKYLNLSKSTFSIGGPGTKHEAPLITADELRPETHINKDTTADVNYAQNVSHLSTKNYVVLGSLVLPRPPEKYRDQAELWEFELQKLNLRNMEGKDRPNETFIRCRALTEYI